MSYRVQVEWVDRSTDPEMDDDAYESGWIEKIENGVATINCDCGPRRVQRPLSMLTVVPSNEAFTELPLSDPANLALFLGIVPDWPKLADGLNLVHEADRKTFADRANAAFNDALANLMGVSTDGDARAR